MEAQLKQSAIGLIPSDWNLVGLEDVAQKLKAGGTPKTTIKSYWDGDIPLVKVEDVVNAGKFLAKTNLSITKEGLDNSNTYLLPSGSILFTMYGTAGEAAINKIEVAPTQNVLGIVPSKEIDGEFLYYALKFSKKKSLELIVDRTIFKHFTLAKAKKLLLPLPATTGEQKTIAAILSKIQEAIESQGNIIKTTAELKAALMRKLFSEGLNGESLKETELGKIPKSWEVKSVGDAFRFTSKPRQLKQNGKIPFIPMELIPIGELYVRDYIFKDKVTSGTYIENGDLLIAKITPSFENGKQAIAKLDFDSAYATTEVIPVKGVAGASSNKYLYYYLLVQGVRSVLAGKMEGSTGRQRLSKSILEETLIPMPTLKEQQSITDIFEFLDKKIDFAKRKKAILTDLFKSMLNNLMSGETRVNNITL